MERFFLEFHPLKKEFGKTWVIPFVCFPLNLKTWESESTWTWLVTRFSILNLLKLLFGSKIYHPTVKQSEAFRLSEDDAADPCPNDTADPCDHGDAPRTDNDANPCGYGGEDATLPRQHCHSKLRKWLRRWGWYGMVGVGAWQLFLGEVMWWYGSDITFFFKIDLVALKIDGCFCFWSFFSLVFLLMQLSTTQNGNVSHLGRRVHVANWPQQYLISEHKSDIYSKWSCYGR